jgi:hypothetical protein
MLARICSAVSVITQRRGRPNVGVELAHGGMSRGAASRRIVIDAQWVIVKDNRCHICTMICRKHQD